MIAGTLADAGRYESVHEGLHAAFEFLRGAKGLADGRYELGGGCYATLSVSKSRPAEGAEFEAHRKYIDVQYLLEGDEIVYWAETASLRESTPYDGTRDYHGLTGEGLRFQFRPGTFYVLFPEDAHMPICHEGQPTAFRKAVVKVPV